METIQEILLLMLSVGGLVLMGVLVTVMISMRRTLDKIGDDIRRLSDETVPLLEKIEETIELTKIALSVITENREKISAASEYVRKVAANIYRIENMLQEQIEPSVAGLAQRLVGLRRGVDTFLEIWHRGRAPHR
jgi:endonuclease III